MPHELRQITGGLTLYFRVLILKKTLNKPYYFSIYGITAVNQVEMPFMPFRSTFAPSHTANATGMLDPALNCTSLGSFVDKLRFITTRQVGPLQQPPFNAPYGSHNPLPYTSCEACVVNVLNPVAFKSSTELTRISGSDKMLPDQIPGLKGP